MRAAAFTNRTLLAAACAGAALAAALVVVAAGRAGSTACCYSVIPLPTQLTAGQSGVAVAKFTAPGGSGTGAATHVVLYVDVPASFGGTSSTCSGPVLVNSGTQNEFTCPVGTVQPGTTVKQYVVFTTPLQAGQYAIGGFASFDGGNGGSGGVGGTNTIPATNVTETLYSSTDKVAGKCTAIAAGSTDSVGTTASATLPQGAFAQYPSASASLGLPCTPAAAGFDPTVPPSLSTGVSFVVLPQLAGTGLAQVTLTFYTLPSGTNAKKFPIYELSGYPTDLTPSSQPVPACVSGVPPAPWDSCVADRSSFGKGGGEFLLLVRGAGGDPGYAG